MQVESEPKRKLISISIMTDRLNSKHVLQYALLGKLKSMQLCGKLLGLSHITYLVNFLSHCYETLVAGLFICLGHSMDVSLIPCM